LKVSKLADDINSNQDFIVPTTTLYSIIVSFVVTSKNVMLQVARVDLKGPKDLLIGLHSFTMKS